MMQEIFQARGLIALSGVGFATPTFVAKEQRLNSVWIQEIDETDLIQDFLEVDPDAYISVNYELHVEQKCGNHAVYAYRDEKGLVHIGMRELLSDFLRSEYENYRSYDSYVFLRHEIAHFLKDLSLIDESNRTLRKRSAARFAELFGRTGPLMGVVARLTERGFGFITSELDGPDLVFYARELHGVNWNDLREGDVLTFEYTHTERGPTATNVRRV